VDNHHINSFDEFTEMVRGVLEKYEELVDGIPSKSEVENQMKRLAKSLDDLQDRMNRSLKED